MSLLNHIQLAASRQQVNVAYMRIGIISSSNPMDGTIKAQVQPDNTETGFIPYSTPWIGWYAPPTVGDQVILLFQEGSKDVPFGALLIYGGSVAVGANVTAPRNVQPPTNIAVGEAILFHLNADNVIDSFIQYTNDGKIIINNSFSTATAAEIHIVTTGNINVSANHAAVQANSILLDSATTTADFLAKYTELKAEFDAHVHADVLPGTGNSGVPTLPLSSAVATTIVKGA